MITIPNNRISSRYTPEWLPQDVAPLDACYHGNTFQFPHASPVIVRWKRGRRCHANILTAASNLCGSDCGRIKRTPRSIKEAVLLILSPLFSDYTLLMGTTDIIGAPPSDTLLM